MTTGYNQDYNYSHKKEADDALPISKVCGKECHMVVMELLVNIWVGEDCAASYPNLKVGELYFGSK